MRMTSFYWHLPLLQCPNYLIYVNACKYSISFNVLKSKCLVALPKNGRNTFKKVNDCIFYINGRLTDLVQSFSHLGHLITSDSDYGEDITIRKHYFKDKLIIYYVILANYPLLLNSMHS